MINNLSLINAIVVMGYRKTGNKFTVAFNGSKGYLSNIEISCEGYQTANNKIFIERLFLENGSLKNVIVYMFYSEKSGIRLTLDGRKPKVVKCKEQKEESPNPENDNSNYPAGSDLPF